MKSLDGLVRNRETVVVDQADSVRDAARVMSERHIGAVPVLDGDRVAGIFSELTRPPRLKRRDRRARSENPKVFSAISACSALNGVFTGC